MSRPVYRRYVRSSLRNRPSSVDALPIRSFNETSQLTNNFSNQRQTGFFVLNNEDAVLSHPLPAAYDDLNIAVSYCEKEVKISHGNDILETGEIQPFTYFLNNGFINSKIVIQLKKLDIEEFRPIQYVMFKILTIKFLPPKNQADIIMLSPTGTGKTLAYLIPIIQFALTRREFNIPFAMIFVPTQTLAEAVKNHLDSFVSGFGLKTALFTRGVQQTVFDFDIAISTMGTYQKIFKDRPDKLKSLKFIVVDEADSILADFPQSQMLRTLKELTRARCLLLSATCKSCMKYLISIDNLFVIECGTLNTVASTVTQRFIEVDSFAKSNITDFHTEEEVDILGLSSYTQCPFDQLWFLLDKIKKRGKPMKTIVFCKRRTVAHFIARKLCLMGIRAASIYGKHNNDKRDELLRKFAAGTIEVLVGTRLITRGIDYDVDTIINYDLPLDVLEYIHRCGRAGRNGNSGTAYTFYDFKNFTDYNPTVIKEIALQIEKLMTENNFDYNSLPPSFQEYLETAVKNDLEDKRQMYQQSILDSN